MTASRRPPFSPHPARQNGWIGLIKAVDYGSACSQFSAEPHEEPIHPSCLAVQILQHLIRLSPVPRLGHAGLPVEAEQVEAHGVGFLEDAVAVLV